jgi:predicted site-specific integrase-resolvase
MLKDKYYKLSDYAKQHSVTYRTAWNRFKAGKIPNAFKDDDGHVLIKLPNSKYDLQKVAIYARVSSNENKSNLIAQAERLKHYATARGYQIVMVVMEVGSGVNDNRKKFSKLLIDDSWGTLIVEHKDRCTRFGFNYIEILLNQYGRQIEVVNVAEDEKSDLMQDLIAIITSFSARMYGLRRSKRKTEQIINCLEKEVTVTKNVTF